MASAELKNQLLDELLACIVDGVPLPNPVVYGKPWLRDAAMMGLVLERAGEVGRIREWILALDDPYDRNNAGHEEPDNLGQALVLVSMVAGADHPLVRSVRHDYPARLDKDGFFTGLTDFGQHPVYQAKWLNWGFERLGLDERVPVPEAKDGYNGLFWMAFREHVPADAACFGDATDYPYLHWAEAHTLGLAPPMHLLGRAGALTWEANASQADYEAMARVRPDLAGQSICVPHSWHAAEAWLYLDDLDRGGR